MTNIFMGSGGVGKGPLKCVSKPARYQEAEAQVKPIQNDTYLGKDSRKLKKQKRFCPRWLPGAFQLPQLASSRPQMPWDLSQAISDKGSWAWDLS